MPRSVVFGVLTVQVGEDALTGWDVRAMGAAVVAGVGLYLGDEFVFVLSGDQFVAARAGHAEGHDVSSVRIQQGCCGAGPSRA
jgi:hypothetical protein